MMEIGTEGQCLIWLCTEPASAATRNYCPGHLAMMEATGDLLPLGYVDRGPLCEECHSEPVRALGLCNRCYKAQRRRDNPRTEEQLEQDRLYRQAKRARERNQSQLATVG